MKRLEHSTDEDLVALLRTGEQAAFEEIYARYWKRMLHFALQKTDEYMDAENIVQDVFVSLWNKRGSLFINKGLPNYLLVSVKYRVIKLFNKQRSQRLYEENALLEVDLLDDSTQEYLDFEELRERLSELLGQLPVKAQLVYKLNKEDGLSHREIAQKLNMSEKAVNAQLVRTKKILRLKLRSFLNTLLL